MSKLTKSMRGSLEGRGAAASNRKHYGYANIMAGDFWDGYTPAVCAAFHV